MEIVIKMGEYAVAGGENDVIKTFALASCVALTVYSPKKRAAGMIHVVLPAPLRGRDARERPGYFAQTGVPLLIDEICAAYGCERHELDICLYGGADGAPRQDFYGVGKKNIDAAKRALLGLGLSIRRADLRGNKSRSITMQVGTGRVEIDRQPIWK